MNIRFNKTCVIARLEVMEAKQFIGPTIVPVSLIRDHVEGQDRADGNELKGVLSASAPHVDKRIRRRAAWVGCQSPEGGILHHGNNK